MPFPEVRIVTEGGIGAERRLDTWPLVSIGMPAFNSERFIQESIDSLLSQDYPNLELIVSDDGSTDATALIARYHAERDTRVTFRPGPRRGERANFNRVLSLARGEYFMWAADHDLWSSRYVSACVEALDADQASVLAYAHTMLIDLEGHALGVMDDELAIDQEQAIERYGALINRLDACNAIYGLMRREAAVRTRGYGPTPAPDHLVLAKLALEGTFIQLPEVMYFRRATRPSETAAEQRLRQPFDLDPSRAKGWLAKGDHDYFRGLRDGHLRAVMNARIPPTDKVRGVLMTVVCFDQRFGVRDSWLVLARRIVAVLPRSVGQLLTRSWSAVVDRVEVPR